MSNDVYHSGYIVTVVCDFFLFPGKGTGFPDIAEIQTESQGVQDKTRKWEFQRYFRAGLGPSVYVVKGTNLKETIQTCG
jgi:hypothetical protein